MKPVYEGNPKHKAPWQPGRKGSLCPPDISFERAQELLLAGVVEGRRRYMADKGRAFCAQQHNATKNRWHGYPTSWKDVPASIRNQLVEAGFVTSRDIKRFWEDIQ
jgi:hypothetical protein